MTTLRPRADSSLLVIVDVQPGFMKVIHEQDRVLKRTRFLAEIARLLEIPIIASEQVPDKLGSSDSSLIPFFSQAAISKTCFGCCESEEFSNALLSYDRSQIFLTGIETHICVSQTALGLLDEDYEVVVCPDAVSARSIDGHKLGMERMRDEGVVPMHTEAVAYEWLGSADHPKFRDAVAIVKKYATV